MAKDFLYLALGDSIATGTLHSFARVTSYTEHLCRTLRGRGRPVRMMSLAHDGDTTGDLLSKLGQGWFQSWVRRADLITLSIGGNNLMGAASIPGFTRVYAPKARAGVRAFCGQWERIVGRLRELNPGCTLAVMTVYNPYNRSPFLGGGWGGDRGLHELTEGYLDKINGEIAARCRGRYVVVDIHALFDRFSNGRMGQVDCLYGPGLYLLRNPHPTAWGHRLIARAHADALKLHP